MILASETNGNEEKSGGYPVSALQYDIKREMRKLKIIALSLLPIAAVVDFMIAALLIAGRGPQLFLYVVSMIVFVACSVGGITAISMYAELWYSYYGNGKVIQISTSGKIIRVAIIAAIMIVIFLVFTKPVPL